MKQKVDETSVGVQLGLNNFDDRIAGLESKLLQKEHLLLTLMNKDERDSTTNMHVRCRCYRLDGNLLHVESK